MVRLFIHHSVYPSSFLIFTCIPHLQVRKTRAEETFLNEDGHVKLLHEKNRSLLTESALRKHDILTHASQLRQFACRLCNHYWWKFVPRTKLVSDCQRCNVRFDALERSKEFGIGRYMCLPCEHTFFARCEATEQHICFKCNKLVGPPFISPRFKPFLKTKYFGDHAKKHFLRVINASNPHDSTGSTVATFMTQDLGSDIFVQVLHGHAQAAKDQTEPDDNDPPSESPKQKYEEEEGDDDCASSDDDDHDSTTAEFGDLESEGILSESEEGVSSQSSDYKAHDQTYSRRRSRASDSDSSDDEDTESVKSSEPDSGISSCSHTGTASSIESLPESV